MTADRPEAHTGEIIGGLGAIDGVHLSGWAFDPERPDERLTIELELDGEPVAAGVADEVFPSLLRQEIGDGAHGFTLTLPDPVAEADPSRMRVMADGHSLGCPAPAPAVIGTVGELDANVLNGWAVNSDDPEHHVAISVELDGRPLARGVADVVFQGLIDAGHGAGDHGYVIPLPATAHGVRRARLVVRADGVTLPHSAVKDELAPGPETPLASGGPPGVVALCGRAGWLFALDRAQADRIEQATPLVDIAVAELVAELAETTRRLREIGVRHVVGIVPQKLVVHDEFLPANTPDLGAGRPGRTLATAAHDDDDLVVIDLSQALRAARTGRGLYLREDEQLSGLGGHVVHRALIKAAGLAVQGLLPLADPAYAPLLGDAPARSATLPRVGRPTSAYTHEDAGPDYAMLMARRVPAESHLEHDGLDAPRVYENPARGGAPRLLVLGHPSAIDPLIPWLAETTPRLAVLTTPVAPLEPIELEMPAVVLHVLDEWVLRAAGEIVEDVAQEPLHAVVDGSGDGPVVEGEGEAEGSRREDPGA